MPFKIIVFLFNRFPSKVLIGKSPYQLLYEEIYDLSQFKAFGTQCLPFLIAYAKNKLDQRSMACVFMGYVAKKRVSLF